MNLSYHLIQGRRWVLTLTATALVLLAASGFGSLFAQEHLTSDESPKTACVLPCADPGGGGG